MTSYFKFFSVLTLSFLAVSCRPEGDEIQQIDQVLNLYVDSAGIDMLNSKVLFSYKTITFNDINGITDNAPVNVNLQKNADTVNYIQYISGARRILIDSSNLDNKLYQSKIAIRYAKPLSSTLNYAFTDTMVINYSFSPQKFQIDNVLYNNKKVFTKAAGLENTVKIFK